MSFWPCLPVQGTQHYKQCDTANGKAKRFSMVDFFQNGQTASPSGIYNLLQLHAREECAVSYFPLLHQRIIAHTLF